MLTLLPETRDDIVALKFTGMITEADLDGQFPEVDAILDSGRKMRLVLDWKDLEGWVPGAKSLGTWFGLRHWAHVDRVAVVADAKWEDEKTRVADICKAATVRRFPDDQRDEAIQWLHHGN